MKNSPAVFAEQTPLGGELVVAGGRAPEVVLFERQVVEFFVQGAEMLGVPKSIAALYGMLFASPSPLSFADLCARLAFSKGSVSQGLRALREVGAVKEVSDPSDRAELFLPDTEMRKLIAHFLESRLEQQLKSGKRRMSLFTPPIDSYAPDEQRVIHHRLAKLRRWHHRTSALIPAMRGFLKLSR